MKRVLDLTGTGLRDSKDYVGQFENNPLKRANLLGLS